MNRCDKGTLSSHCRPGPGSPAAPIPALDSDRAQHTTVWGCRPSPSTATLVLDLGMWAKREAGDVWG